MAGTAAVICWHLTRPALWLDESASVVAKQRSWAHLWTLLQGWDAPMVPYYALLKVWSWAALAVAPGLSGHPELLYRWPSVVSTVLAAGAMAWWLARQASSRLAACAGAVLLLASGTSRYGQEVRPYAFVLLAAVLTAIAWWRLCHHPGLRSIAGYGVAVALLASTNLLALSLVAAHLVAALVIPRSGRWAVLVRTMIGAGAGLLVVSPFLVVAVREGHGPRRNPDITVSYLRSVFVHLFSSDPNPFLGVGAVLLLAVLGLSRAATGRHRSIARFAGIWAIVPVILMAIVIVLRPNLAMDRYLIGVLPAWAILGGLGLLTIAELAGRAGAWAGLVAGLTVIGALVAAQSGSLTEIRSAGGHDEDIRPALDRVQRPDLRTLPVAVYSPNAAVETVAYTGRSFEKRFTGLRVQRDQPMIWPEVERMGPAPRLVLLLRAEATGRCEQLPGDTPATHALRCMPKTLRTRFRIESAEPGGTAWSVVVLASRNPGTG